MKVKKTIRALGVIACLGYGVVACVSVPQPVSDVKISNSSTCRNAPPTYPDEAQRRGMEGVVKAAVLVAADGTYLQGEVRKSSGSRLLDDATIAAAATWCWKPKYANGVAVDAWHEFDYTWSLM